MPSLITVTYSGLDKAIANIATAKSKLSNVDTSMMVNAIAAVWKVNFDSEGSMVGGWRDLAESTQILREQRGFDPQHPILVQTGVLRRIAIDALLNAKGPRRQFGPGVSMSYVGANNSATLRISGAKVDNQFRVRGPQRETSQPPRPFWFVDPTVEKAAADGLRKWLSMEIG